MYFGFKNGYEDQINNLGSFEGVFQNIPIGQGRSKEIEKKLIRNWPEIGQKLARS
jgi:hypothetical protein